MICLYTTKKEEQSLSWAEDVLAEKAALNHRIPNVAHQSSQDIVDVLHNEPRTEYVVKWVNTEWEQVAADRQKLQNIPNF